MHGSTHPHLTMTFDFGTTSLKTALVDRGGAIIAHANQGYPLLQPRAGWAEQDPRQLWDASAQAGREALRLAGLGADAVRSVVFVAPWKGIILVDEGGRVLRDALIWMDARAVAEAKALNQRAGTYVGTGQEYWPRLMWLKQHEPEAWAASRWIMGVTTYLKWMATGEIVTEPSDDFIRSERPSLRARYEAILEGADLLSDLDKFPPATAAGDVVGHLTAEAAAHLGLEAGIPVFGGFGDLPAITLGAGPLVPGATHIYFGTSSWFACVLNSDEALDSPLRFTIDHRHDGALYCLQSGCLAYDWIVDQVYAPEKSRKDAAFFEFIDAQVAEIAPGSENLLATHWLTGELPPLSKSAKGVYLNLTTTHDRRHMVRAMMESVCYAHRMSVEWFETQTGRHLDEIIAVGGGASSPIWMQMLADVLGRAIVVPDAPRFVGAIGAYRCSLIESGDPASQFSRAPEMAKSKRFEANPDNGPIYDRLFSHYRRIHPALTDLFESLNAAS